ncbi:MAG TPA: rhodanese-like domain-containing protein [Bauldia sp.]|nr:rhodanese-like domain-containing protein [Bauldia sp.]
MRILKDIDVREAQALLDRDAIFIDVREPHEQAVERIPGAISAPLSALARGTPIDAPAEPPKVFLCASGNRTRNNSAALAALVDGEAYSMAGGIMAWRRAGYPTERG